MLAYELWETDSGNLMAAFDTQAEALAAVSKRAKQHGPESVATLTLVSVDDADEDGDIVTLASGSELLARATLSASASNTAAQAKTIREAQPAIAAESAPGTSRLPHAGERDPDQPG
jgi:hypothetical protein